MSGPDIKRLLKAAHAGGQGVDIGKMGDDEVVARLSKRPGYRREEEFQAAIETRARVIWAERETMLGAGHFAAQSWEQGSATARRATLAMARADLLK